MKLSHKLYWSITLILGYIFILNVIPFIQDSRMNQQIFTSFPNGEDGVSFGSLLKGSVGDSVSFMIESPRIYGTIKKDATESNLSLFNLVPVPVSRKGFNFFLIHIPFLGMFCFIMLKGGKNKDEKIASSLYPNAYPDWNWNNDFDTNEYKSTSYCIWS